MRHRRPHALGIGPHLCLERELVAARRCSDHVATVLALEVVFFRTARRESRKVVDELGLGVVKVHLSGLVRPRLPRKHRLLPLGVCLVRSQRLVLNRLGRVFLVPRSITLATLLAPRPDRPH